MENTYSTSNINDLPLNPLGGGGGGGSSNNVSFSANEKTQSTTGIQQYQPNIAPTPSQHQSNNVALDQSTINQIISGLQQAGQVTQLPSRDIPTSTESLTNDPQVQPNYIPQTEVKDYIKEDDEGYDDMINDYNQKVKKSNTLDNMYTEIQTPLLISVLFFMFQLPIFKKLLFSSFPMLYFKDGNINLYGYLFTSALFGILYHVLNKVMWYFSTF